MRATLVLAVVLLSGCGEIAAESLPPARAAEPQRSTLGWRETYPARGPGLVFRVHELEVRKDGWSVEIAVTNASRVPFELDTARPRRAFGVMLFGTGDVAELEQGARTGRLPALRRATSITPRPPRVLAPGRTWRTALSAPGSLGDGSWLRVSFGPLRARGEPPAGMEPVVVWITDRAYRL